ncbi:MAG: glutamyl-tRNA reductase [Caldilineaceae bacterium]|nr:glutamyl-tRNA reductase [Caldilineaceae bacterium]
MNNPPIVCLGVNHRTAPVEMREQLACTLDQLLPNGPTSGEVALLSTCNRLEIYTCSSSDPETVQQAISEILTGATGVDAAAFAPHLYRSAGWDAVGHLLRVSTGLDSLVLGEPQILGQVTDAFVQATEAGVLGHCLTQLFRAAIRAGKRARSETAISANPASISSVALALAQQHAGDLRQQRVLVIGAGEMGQLTLKALQHRGAGRVEVVNRTFAKAENAAANFGAYAFPLERLAERLALVNVVIAATGAPRPLLTEKLVAHALAQRPDRPLLLVDLAVPRDVDPTVADLPGARLFDVDDLRGSLDEALAAREAEVPRVEEIIAEEVVALQDNYRKMSVHPLIVDLRRKAENIRQREMERTLRNLGDIDDATLRHIQKLSQVLVNQLLHEPTLYLKEKAVNGEAEDVEMAREMFGL